MTARLRLTPEGIDRHPTCDAPLLLQVFLPISYEGHRHFWRDRLNQGFILLLCLLAADVLVNTAWLYTSAPFLDALVAFRLAPYLRY